jgi:Leucine-rich repeat (LRR) protein
MALQLLLQISFFVLICPAIAINPEADALLRWKSTLVGASSLSSWSPANSICSWFGVACDGAGHVTALRLSGAGINGNLDAFYSTAFQNLTRLDLSNNYLVGTIPANLSMLLTLTFLDLSSNGLSGAIPYQLSKLPMIAHLNLENNQLLNPESARFLPMPSLKFLSLRNNSHLPPVYPQLHVDEIT